MFRIIISEDIDDEYANKISIAFEEKNLKKYIEFAKQAVPNGYMADIRISED